MPETLPRSGCCTLARVTSTLRRRLRTASPYLLAGLLGGAGVLHFVAPGPYAGIVPSQLPGDPTLYVYVSGVAEIACAVAVAVPRTRRLGGLAAAALFLAVFPANLQMALDSRGGSALGQIIAFGRLPLQIPLVLWALRCAGRSAVGAQVRRT